MNAFPHIKSTQASLVLSTLLGSLLLVSCASATNQASAPMAAPGGASQGAPAPADNYTDGREATTSPVTPTTQVPSTRPQLIKSAELSLTVSSIEETMQAVSAVVKNQQGDLLGYQDQKPLSSSTHHTATLQIRLPQEKLDAALDELAQLGTVQSRTLTAEDVTLQLVDYEARLRNLRKTEATLLEIMERSGSVGDVLKVAQELSRVREAIEQNTAQFTNLRNRVAYSTINLSLREALATTSPQQPLGLEVQEAWEKSTHSVGEFTAGLITIGIWLLAYSPYLLALGASIWLMRKLRPQPTIPQPAASIVVPNDEPL